MKKIKLGGKRGTGKFALIDDEDYLLVSKYSWHVDTDGAARAPTRDNKEKKMIMKRMHRIILDAKPGDIVDHVNGNRLNNCKNNLRIVDDQQNAFNRRIEIRNKSGYKGVAWDKRSNKWQAKIELNDKKIYLGFYKDKKKAAKVYNKAAQKYFGEFARLNEI